MKRFKFSFFLLFAVIITAPVAHAALATPRGLSYGDKFHWVFVTSSGTTAMSTDISDYNAFVDNAANTGDWTSGVGGEWKVIGSTAATSAKINIGTSDYPIYDLNGNLVADDTIELWGGDLQYNIGVDEDGGVYNSYVWTGTEWDGDSHFNPLGGGSGGAVHTGDASTYDPEWIDDTNIYKSASNPRLYGMSAVQTVPIPGAVWLLGSGLIGIVGIRRKFKK